MNLNQQIRKYRKEAGLTQEQIANCLGVSTPAVNKWERGNTYPDISLLPALARLLKIDLNELFSFREELTEVEIAQFTNELSELALRGKIGPAFEMAAAKIQEYPHCDSLLFTAAVVLNSALTLSAAEETQKKEYERKVTDWLEQSADSEDERVRISAVTMLAGKYNQMEEYEKASQLLDRIPDFSDVATDPTLLRATVLAHQEGEAAAAVFLEGRLLQTATRLQSYLYRLTELEEQSGNHHIADELAAVTQKLVPLLDLWNYGTVVPPLLLALWRKDASQSIALLRTLLDEAQKPWKLRESPLYHRIPAQESVSSFGDSFISELLIRDIENKEDYAFLREEEDLRKLLSEYKPQPKVPAQ